MMRVSVQSHCTIFTLRMQGIGTEGNDSVIYLARLAGAKTEGFRG